MITIYTEITVEEAGEILRKNGWKPVEGLYFKSEGNWQPRILEGICLREGSLQPFQSTFNHNFMHCAKVTEIDPCKAPVCCPELEPWMAYVGMGAKNISDAEYYTFGLMRSGGRWLKNGNEVGFDSIYYAIDVRTAWAQEHFPEHCKQRAYVESDAFDKWYNDRLKIALDIDAIKLLREAYELGQSNPIK